MRYEGMIYRPPGEWKSYLLQCTIGCSNNSCTFCSMWDNKRFRIRPLKDILDDIEMSKAYGNGVRRVFLCDGDAIIMKQEELLTILDRLYKTFPYLEKVTTYAGPKSTMSKTPAQLKELNEAGLKRAYLGVETGDDELLKKVKKGATAQEILDAALLLKDCGFDLWTMIILGLAGHGEPSKRHALATAELMNKMVPQHLSALTYMYEPGTPMYQDVQQGKSGMLTPARCWRKHGCCWPISHEGPIHFTSNHASNYLAFNDTIRTRRRRCWPRSTACWPARARCGRSGSRLVGLKILAFMRKSESGDCGGLRFPLESRY